VNCARFISLAAKLHNIPDHLLVAVPEQETWTSRTAGANQFDKGSTGK